MYAEIVIIFGENENLLNTKNLYDAHIVNLIELKKKGIEPENKGMYASCVEKIGPGKLRHKSQMIIHLKIYHTALPQVRLISLIILSKNLGNMLPIQKNQYRR